MNDDQLLRYARHVLLDDIGIAGQTRLLAAHVLVVGAGGLGSPVLMYLASAGVGTLTVIDDDRVELSNLQRQIVHDMSRLGQPKAQSAAQTVAALNPDVHVVAVDERASAARLNGWVAAADVVVDCSDNLTTRHAVNAACVAARKPLVFGAALGFDGQLAVFDTRNAAAPCFACVFPPGPAVSADADCATFGVFAPLVGVIGSLQAAEALKLLAGIGTPMAGRLQLWDARTMQWTALQAPRRIGCPVCGNRPVA